MMEKAARSDADQVMLDLEDAVAASERKSARGKIVEAVKDCDWNDKLLSVRINGTSTKYAYGDIVEIIKGSGEDIDTLVIPKIKSTADVHFVDKLLGQLEADLGMENTVGLELLIEEVAAMQAVSEIARASDRVQTLVFGPGDYSSSQGVTLMNIGDSDDPYPGDIWHFARSTVVIAARANGIDAIDGPFGDYSDIEGYRTECVRSNALGFVGKWAIHPSQIPVANEVYSPDDEVIEHAQRVVNAMASGAAEDLGVVQVDGRMVDEATVRNARAIVDRARELNIIE